MSNLIFRKLADTAATDHPFPPSTIFLHELPPRPEKLPRGPRHIRDGLWSRPSYSFDDRGQEIMAMTHADGHTVIWPVISTADAALIDPDGYVVDRPDAWREAHAVAFHWGAP